MSKLFVEMSISYLNYIDLAKLRKVDKEFKELTSDDRMWDLCAKIQEGRMLQGRYFNLYTQYMMSPEQAAALPPSSKFK